ncbi:NUDIX domain-containing protein [Arthrobacter alpinus]|uniref:NUDIX domain-containing protein n=1 Tax=Arthrobacter alpinus TaxID=656366 RepID=A0A1H5MI78_9MICC|nr:CoA pyrophosphatase [Arthrobacter alpinus]SEE89102.1 NUDIX domain-containing protein [Arthrobacter alpinus]
MSAYADLIELAKKAATLTEISGVGRPALWPAPADAATFRKAAVLMLFGALDEVPAASEKPLASADLDILLVERAATLNDHPGQVAFPGGGVGALDDSLSATALREAHEETGLDPLGVEILGTLPEVPLVVSNFMVTPVVAWWARQTPVDVVDFGESAQVFRVPVRDLLDPDNRFTAVVKRGRDTYRGPAFAVNGVVVWGFTAGILNYVFHELGWSVPWDEQREIPAPI